MLHISMGHQPAMYWQSALPFLSSLVQRGTADARAFTCEAAGMQGACGEVSLAAQPWACRGPACRAPSDPCLMASPGPWGRAPCPCTMQPLRHVCLHSSQGKCR